ncbi:fibrillarin-like rRNA/tRNA 2'-O-methyltransferase [Candidatus Woesearchaeota archaeon]|nr:MAG: fibrillarin-like protein pre-rRNA processing protein [archaeon GW2011_AR18]MBS3162105.1 fibrillarin-like rRNA/tRNA 2'-O-methyltransferase [Candidatus Woesearchaeota archaeon]HIH25265.1 fibrillarin-like rRNA/tRNA 2'-O-methyltransferase [Nanoarchaeota archaeon]
MKLETLKFDNVFNIQDKNRRILVTKNLSPGKAFFKERLFNVDDIEYREFNPTRSKLAASIVKKISFMPIKKDEKILYLGASHGYTPSFVSDIIGDNGLVFCLDFAPRVVRDLYMICEERKNMIPILADANKPETYKDRISNVNIIFQDIAQKIQVEILFKNLIFLNPKGYVVIAIKSRSIDVTQNPRKIFREVEEKLSSRLKIIDKRELDPFERDHILFVCQKK